MDLLFREYASPFILLDKIIESGNFVKWIDKFLKSHKEKIQWEYWLHKEYEQSWIDYKKDCDFKERTYEELQNFDDKEIETTVKQSFDVLENFNPTKME